LIVELISISPWGSNPPAPSGAAYIQSESVQVMIVKMTDSKTTEISIQSEITLTKRNHMTEKTNRLVKYMTLLSSLIVVGVNLL
jgi:hypothetical protein